MGLKPGRAAPPAGEFTYYEKLVDFPVWAILLALLWAYLVIPKKAAHPQRRLLFSTYLKSQFAKYIPGNVFQYAARHALEQRFV